jgi:cell division septation protein DedD
MAAAEIAPIERISPISPAAPPQQGTPLPSPEKGAAGGAAFSVPLISSLERDQYYLQLRAFSQAETVNQELTKIGKAYPLVILSGKESGKTIYRILLGPINQGESNALLQRFKNMGYTDAFLRQGS